MTTNNPLEVDIHPILDPEDATAAEQLQRVVWPGNDIEIAPAHVMLTSARNGGLLAGAWEGKRLIGFVWGFLGFDVRISPPRTKHCSHQLGVHPDYRSTGVGFSLKCFQREHVLNQGLDLITWTYDPLLSRNARLNITKLGATCNTYHRNEYGELRDSLNVGLPTDRFQVDWWIRGDHVAACLTGKDHSSSLSDLLVTGAQLINPLGSDGLPTPLTGHGPQTNPVLVEIPTDFLALKAADPVLALRWRVATRTAFEMLFERGFAVTDFILARGVSTRAVYVLTQGANHAHRSYHTPSSAHAAGRTV